MRRAPALLLCCALLSGCSGGAADLVVAPSVEPVASLAAAPARPVPASTPRPKPAPLRFGGDISWPSCPLGTPGHLPKRPAKGLPLPGPQAQLVILGLTNGPGFYPNPCLAWEVQVARRRHLATAAYAFTTLPNAGQVARYGRSGPYRPTTALGRVRNAAWAQVQVNLASLRRTGLRTPIVWMDVEPQDYLEPWGTDVAVNRAVLEAAGAAYHRAGYATGFYSSPGAWKLITGGLRDPSPTWVTSGPRPVAVALARCAGPSFSGGPVALTQYWVDATADLDRTCPLAQAQPEQFFALP